MLLRQGVDLEKLTRKSPARAWNAIYSLAVENMDKKERAKFDNDLFKRPMGVSSRRRSDSFDSALEAAAAEYLRTLERQGMAIDS